MKNFNLILLCILLSITTSYSQTSASKSVSSKSKVKPLYSATHTLTEGVHKLLVGGDLGFFIVKVEQGKITTMERNTSGMYVKLNPYDTGSKSGAADCPCGLNSWQDETLKQSISVCQPCNGTDGKFDFLLTIDKITGE